uniref:NADH-ubiquinone oxidoreductase chain 6 n=1 Tax=Asiemphytus rufocephalus TaxID=1742410 RepID=A0A1I9K788_9HYME|nr:NADH dehydrogenase subunit 6 [Asiemphytus rufocephalus]
MIKFLLIILFMNSILFYSTKTPLSMGLMLLIQTLNITLISGIMSLNFWYMYILFLIMLGGMLILFIYVSSLSSNQKFIFDKNFLLINLILMMMIFLMIILMKNLNYFNLDMIKLMNVEIEENFMLKMSLNKLYNKPTNQIMIMLINYLLITLFIIVKITNINMGALRKNF